MLECIHLVKMFFGLTYKYACSCLDIKLIDSKSSFVAVENAMAIFDARDI